MALVTGGALTGTFTSTGASDSIQVSSSGVLTLNFGSGTVSLQRKNLSGDFVPTGNTYSSDEVGQIFISGEYNLNCTSHASDIDYEIQP